MPHFSLLRFANFHKTVLWSPEFLLTHPPISPASYDLVILLHFLHVSIFSDENIFDSHSPLCFSLLYLCSSLFVPFQVSSFSQSNTPILSITTFFNFSILKAFDPFSLMSVASSCSCVNKLHDTVDLHPEWSLFTSVICKEHPPFGHRHISL